MNNIKRIFHPIGQGAFYSEHFEDCNFNIVYDCGVLKAITHGEKVVSQAFTKDDEIDILFISHLDYDHISLVKKLKDTVKRIKRVILPLVYDKNYVLGLYKAMNNGSKYNDVIKLIDNPHEYFGKETQIIYVKPVEGSETKREYKTTGPDNEPGPIDLRGAIDLSGASSTTPPREIESGTPIKFDYPDWIFIPFNHEFIKRREKLRKMLEKEKLSIDDITSKALDNITENGEIVDKLKKIYGKIGGDINENSMFLYSGPSIVPNNYKYEVDYHMTSWHLGCRHHCPYFDDMFYRTRDRVACIYCGDGDLNKVDILHEIGVLENNVGTFQIPHHGSIKSFNKDKIKGNCICPISVGNNNYGHPSSRVIADIIGEDSIPIIISDDKFSGFIEIIQS